MHKFKLCEKSVFSSRFNLVRSSQPLLWHFSFDLQIFTLFSWVRCPISRSNCLSVRSKTFWRRPRLFFFGSISISATISLFRWLQSQLGSYRCLCVPEVLLSIYFWNSIIGFWLFGCLSFWNLAFDLSVSVFFYISPSVDHNSLLAVRKVVVPLGAAVVAAN